MTVQHYPFELLPLPYLYDSLEPHIDTETMYLHHSRHLRAYVDNLNRLLKPYPEFHDWTLERPDSGKQKAAGRHPAGRLEQWGRRL